MKNLVSTAFALAITFSAGLTLLPGAAYGSQHEPAPGEEILVCYAWDLFPNERFKLNIKRHSPLSKEEEEKNFGHASQTAYSVHGKEVGGCGGNTMLALDGTVVTGMATRVTKGPTGAHMGIVAHASRGDGSFLGNDFCRSFTLDCTSEEQNPAPDRWRCQSRNEFDVYHGTSSLKRVDETQDPRCSIFENGTAESMSEAVAQSGPAPGLRADGVRPQLPASSDLTILKGPIRPADIKVCCFGSTCWAPGLGEGCGFTTYSCTGETETHWTGCKCVKHCG